MNLFGIPTVEFCEKAGAGLIKRPFYAISNIPYFVVGLVILRKNTSLSKHFGYTALFIGFASLLYDVSYTYISQLVDLLAMLVFINLLIHFSLKRYFTISSFKVLVAQVLLVLAGMGAIIYFKSFAGEFVFGVFIVAEIILELFLYRKGKTKKIHLLLSGLALFSLGFIIWLPDALGVLCDPSNILNGRGIFHLMTAGTVYILYRYFENQE